MCTRKYVYFTFYTFIHVSVTESLNWCVKKHFGVFSFQQKIERHLYIYYVELCNFIQLCNIFSFFINDMMEFQEIKQYCNYYNSWEVRAAAPE